MNVVGFRCDGIRSRARHIARPAAWPPLVLLWGMAGAMAVAAAEPTRRIAMEDVTSQTGIDFIHTDGSDSGKHYIVEYLASGLAVFDYDGDGRPDIFLLNGAPLPGSRAPTQGCRLYRNLGNWKFRDVTRQAGVNFRGHALGVAVADYDNDGLPDLYLSNFGANVLYHNNGNGTFTDVTAKTGVGRGPRVGAGTCFLDIDRDGLLDLYAGNYILFSYARHVAHTDRGVPAYASPQFYVPDKDTLFHNDGDGAWTDVTEPSGIGAVAGRTMGAVCLDFDNDGNTDIVAGNDAMENFLFRGDGCGHFQEIGLLAGIAYDGGGRPRGTMGVECGDYDNDGFLDLFMTAYQNQTPVMFRNSGTGYFEDVTFQIGLGAIPGGLVTWGAGLVDFDNDGDRDLFIACGHIQDNITKIDDTTSYEQPNLVLENVGAKFVDVSRTAIRGMAKQYSSRGAAFADFDGDGRIDVVVLNARQKPTVLRNVTPEAGHWIALATQGVKTNRDGVGARVIVSSGGAKQTAEVHSGRSYQSHYGAPLHFGLGGSARADRIEVHWIGGGVDVFHDTPGDRLITIVEGGAPQDP